MIGIFLNSLKVSYDAAIHMTMTNQLMKKPVSALLLLSKAFKRLIYD